MTEPTTDCMSARTDRRCGPALLLAALVLAGSCAQEGGDQRSAILITIDTIRVDGLGCYSGLPRVSPHLDALAAESVVYDQARTVAPLTLPAHSSMLTGLYPPRHTVRDNSLSALPAAADTLAEAAKAAGHQTAAFVAARVLGETYGLDQGFEFYDQPPRPEVIGHHFAQRPASDVVGAARKWFAQRDPERPFFAWIHLFDPHQPLQPSAEFLERVGGNPYHGAIAEMDAVLGPFFAELRAEGILDEAVVLVVGDHGEAFGDHGEATHGSYCYESTMLVPFFVRYPDGHRGGERSSEPVSVVDVHPTLLEALGVGAAQDVDGSSLYRTRVSDSRGVYVESYHGFLQYGWSPLAGWVQNGTKYLHSSVPELYDLAADPAELRNLASAGDPRALAAQRALSELDARTPLPSERVTAEESAQLEELRALGYTAGGGGSDSFPGLLEATDRPSPKDSAWEQQEIDRASFLTQQQKFGEAIAVYRRMLERNPRNPSTLHELSFLLMNQGRWAEARVTLEQRLELPPEQALTYMNLGAVWEQLGDRKKALAHLQHAAELNPNNLQLLRHIIRLLAQERRQDEIPRYRELLEQAQAN